MDARAARSRSLAVALACALAGSACVAPGADVELAPLFTRVSAAGGGTAGEALFGAATAERAAPDAPLSSFALRPLFGWTREPDGPAGPVPAANARSRTEVLYPLGRTTAGVRTSSSWLLPLYLWRSRETAEGGRRYNLTALPGLFFAGDQDGLRSAAWFPLGGRVEDFLTYEEVVFALFPLYLSARRDGKQSRHFLFPVLGWTRGGGESSFRLWPLWTRSRVEGFHDRTTVLWPLLHFHTSFQHLGPASERHTWMVWPLLGRTRRGTYRATTVLWPFFGWATDPRSDFWAVDAPWPLVRLQGGGRNPLAEERVRLWPFWSRFATEGLEDRSWLWPLVRSRSERGPDFRRESFHVLPLWQSWRAESAGEPSSWWKLWPLAQRRSQGERSRLSVLAPFPFHRDEVLDRTWAWPFELWTSARDAGSVLRERAWGGLWRRERDAREDRRSLSGLFSRRTWRDADGRVEETSLLFGLLRWRSMAGGVELLVPAFPGPGWPAERSGLPLCADDAAAPPHPTR